MASFLRGEESRRELAAFGVEKRFRGEPNPTTMMVAPQLDRDRVVSACTGGHHSTAATAPKR